MQVVHNHASLTSSIKRGAQSANCDEPTTKYPKTTPDKNEVTQPTHKTDQVNLIYLAHSVLLIYILFTCRWLVLLFCLISSI